MANNTQYVDLSTKQGRTNFAALLVGRVIIATVEASYVTLKTDRGVATIAMEGDRFDEQVLTAAFLANEPEWTRCRWCGIETNFLGTRECQRCFELRDKLEGADPEVLKKMAEEMNITPQESHG